MSDEMVGTRESFLRGHSSGYMEAMKDILQLAKFYGKKTTFELDGDSAIYALTKKLESMIKEKS